MNTGDAEVISKTIDEIVEPDALIRTPLPLGTTGAQKLKDVFARLHQVYADLQVTIEEMIAEGDKVVSRNSVTGTHQGAYMGGMTFSPLGMIRPRSELIVKAHLIPNNTHAA
jgi:hypothetical protein